MHIVSQSQRNLRDRVKKKLGKVPGKPISSNPHAPCSIRCSITLYWSANSEGYAPVLTFALSSAMSFSARSDTADRGRNAMLFTFVVRIPFFSSLLAEITQTLLQHPK